MIAKKAKASVSVVKPRTLALALGGLAEWLNAAGLQPVDGAQNTVQGFKSLTRRHLVAPRVKAGTSTRGLIPTAEAARVANSSIWLLAVNRKEIHGDLSQLHGRNGEGWKGPERYAALQVSAAR